MSIRIKNDSKASRQFKISFEESEGLNRLEVGVTGGDRLWDTSDLFMIGHSHAVALLDGVSEWRKSFLGCEGNDPRYSETFQGWFSGSVPDEPICVEVNSGFDDVKEIAAWVISAHKFHKLVEGESKHPRIHPRFSEKLAAWRHTGKPILSVVNGNEHALAMIASLPAYDFIDEGVDRVDRDVPLIDGRIIDSAVDGWVDIVYRSILAMRVVGNCPIYHALPPPPRESPHKTNYQEGLSELIKVYGFIPDHLRLKWYKRYCERLTDKLEEIGSRAVTPPIEVTSNSGLLLERFSDGLTHGNAEYGKLMMDKVFREVFA